MEKLLYIGSSGLGENLQCTSGMELLSAKYDISLLLSEIYLPAFVHYPFLKEIIVAPRGILPNRKGYKLPDSLIERLHEFDGGLCVSHFETCYELLESNGLQAINPLKFVQYANAPYNVSRSFLARLGMTVENLSIYDSTIRLPAPMKVDGQKRIVLYQGSFEILRKLPDWIFSELAFWLQRTFPFHEIIAIRDTELPLKNVAQMIGSKQKDNLANIIELFQKGVDLMIGPDSGITNLALGFKIPQIWLESRERMEFLIDPSDRHLVDVYRMPSPACARECRARLFLAEHGTSQVDQIPALKATAPYFSNLECYMAKNAPCLSFTEKDVMDVINLCKKRLTE